MTRLTCCTALILFLAIAACVAFAADTIESELAPLVGKTLTLRHFYKGETLYYDLDGTLITHSDPGPWTMYGKFLVKKISVKNDHVRFEGRRAWVRFEGDGSQQTNLITEIPIVVEVALAFGPERLARWKTAAPNVLLMQGTRMVDEVPDYWKVYFGETPARSDSNKEVKGEFMAGRLIRQVNPQYPVIARKNRQQAQVVLRAIIGADGALKQMQIRRPGGFGFDEAVIEAVRQWKYKPFEIGGEPIEVETDITVNFALGG